MTEIVRPRDLELPKRRSITLFDCVVAAIIAAVIITLIFVLFGQLKIRQEVSAARVVTDRVASDVTGKKAADARSLGDSKFQKAHPESQLSSLFVSAASAASGPRSVSKQIVTNDSNGQNVGVIYKYSQQHSYYIRVIASKPSGSGKWYLSGISGNPSEAALTSSR